MSQDFDVRPFTLPPEITMVETALVNFDQWILTVGLRLYRGEEILGMAHVVFDNPVGHRVLSEGDMLKFPWPESTNRKMLVHEISSGGWLTQEKNFGNMLQSDELKEFVVFGEEHCVSVISRGVPKIIVTDLNAD